VPKSTENTKNRRISGKSVQERLFGCQEAVLDEIGEILLFWTKIDEILLFWAGSWKSGWGPEIGPEIGAYLGFSTPEILVWVPKSWKKVRFGGTPKSGPKPTLPHEMVHFCFSGNPGKSKKPTKKYCFVGVRTLLLENRSPVWPVICKVFCRY
tara:strand:- start:136 stop:594 length:459 start_codon:yes stop_codon:yes gene_type:complete